MKCFGMHNTPVIREKSNRLPFLPILERKLLAAFFSSSPQRNKHNKKTSFKTSGFNKIQIIEDKILNTQAK